MGSLTLPIIFTLCGLGFVVFMIWRVKSNSAARKKLRGFETRKEVEDAVEDLSDDERYDAGNKWVR